MLWAQLRAKQVKNCKFRRQYSVGKFILDFYSPRAKLAVEIDGDSHFESDQVERYNQERQKFIESLGIKLLRFTNNDIYESLNDVLGIIKKTIKTPSPSPLPRGSVEGVYPLKRGARNSPIKVRNKRNSIRRENRKIGCKNTKLNYF